MKGQNVIDIYQDFEGKVSNWLPKQNYDGEYIMDIHKEIASYSEINGTTTNPYEKPFLLEDIWYSPIRCYSGPRQLNAGVELVSFPFWADCSETDLDNNTNRILTVLTDEQLQEIQYTERNVLSSVLFGTPPTTAESRNYIPHSVFRHKLYIYCGKQAAQEPLTDPLNPPLPTPNPDSGPKLDSLVFTVDLTRNRMQFYPFSTENDVALSTDEFDIILHPFFMLNDDYTATNNDLGEINYYDLANININLCEEFTCSENTINYFPTEGVTDLDICDEVDCLYPENPNASLYPIDFIHPSPFSLAGFLIQGESGHNPVGYKAVDENSPLVKKSGIKHTYVIDKDINLNLINPNEKITYNPSEVHIETTDLIFPSGYTFKTARGLYPTVDEVNNTTICDAADELEDQRLIHVPTDLQNTISYTTSEGITLTAPAFYILESGSQLTIEPCVSLFDVTFVVKVGAKLVYHPEQTYGNFQIVEEAADVVPSKEVQVMLPHKTCNDCRCIQEYNVEQDLVIDEGEPVLWFRDQTVRGNVTVKNGGELRILGCTIEFADADVTDGVLFSSITVEAGGRLELNQATLTILNGDQPNNCAQRHQTWGGIRLKGVAPEEVGEHAVLDATNSTISYAEKAIYADGNIFNDFGQTNWECGGKVSARNITFTNNSIAYYAIGNNPPNVFVGCTFALDSAHPSRAGVLEEFVSHVFIANEDGLRFTNCVFKNNLSIVSEENYNYETIVNLPFIEDRSTGILAYESDFEVSYKAPPYAHPAPMNNESAFEGLYRGIETYSFVDAQMEIRETNFRNTLQCITSNANEGDIIENNHFLFNITPFFEEDERPDDNTPPSNYDAWAVYTFGAGDYDINENIIEFPEFNPPSPPGTGGGGQGSFTFIHPNSYGIIVNNTAGGAGMINENQFYNLGGTLLTGAQTEENNLFVEMGCNIYHNFEGMQEWLINPNDFLNDNEDFENLLANQGEGCGTDAAGNLFQNNCGDKENIRIGQKRQT